MGNFQAVVTSVSSVIMAKEKKAIDILQGRNVRRLRLDRGWSQEDLAERYSAKFKFIQKSKVSGWESGSVPLGKTILYRLKVIFSCDDSEFRLSANADVPQNEIEKRFMFLGRLLLTQEKAEEGISYLEWLSKRDLRIVKNKRQASAIPLVTEKLLRVAEHEADYSEESPADNKEGMEAEGDAEKKKDSDS